MRNLVEHPITDQEIIDCLTAIREALIILNSEKGEAGDLRPLLVQKAIDRVRKYPFQAGKSPLPPSSVPSSQHQA